MSLKHQRTGQKRRFHVANGRIPVEFGMGIVLCSRNIKTNGTRGVT